jgi:hypothetical protein
MKLAMGADLEIVVKFLDEDHGAALLAFGTEAFGNVALAGFAAAHFGFFYEAGFVFVKRGRDGRFNGFQTEGFLGEGGCSHVRHFASKGVAG